jgi:hypothetical protein
VKFIRRVIGRPAKDFAAALAIAPETYSRWENGKASVGAWADKQVRFFALALLQEKGNRVHADPATIVDMRILPRSAGDVPRMEIRLVQTPHRNNHDDEEWDVKLAA